MPTPDLYKSTIGSRKVKKLPESSLGVHALAHGSCNTIQRLRLLLRLIMSFNPQRPTQPITPRQSNTGSKDQVGQPRPFIPAGRLPSPPRRDRGDDRWVAGAKQVLLRCQREFFNQVDGQGPAVGKKDVEKELQQALLHTRSNTPREQKKEIRRWAMNQHIAEVETKVKDPEERKTILHNHMTALFSVRDDDGGDSMWALQGLQQFSCAIEKQEAILADMRGTGSQRQLQVGGSAMGVRELQATSPTAGSTTQGALGGGIGMDMGMGIGAGRGSPSPRPSSATNRGGRGGRDAPRGGFH
jgi:hypothetical protein